MRGWALASTTVCGVRLVSAKIGTARPTGAGHVGLLRVSCPSMKHSPTRVWWLRIFRGLFALLTACAIGAILSYGYTETARDRFISQMNDAGMNGGVIMWLVLAAASTAAAIAWLHGRTMAAALRMMIAGLIYVLVTTKATSGDHLMAYAAVVLLYGTISIFTVMALSDHWDVFAGVSLLFGLLAMIMMVKIFAGGPAGQKSALIVFLVVECLTVYVCFPRQIAWFEGLDGT